MAWAALVGALELSAGPKANASGKVSKLTKTASIFGRVQLQMASGELIEEDEIIYLPDGKNSLALGPLLPLCGAHNLSK